MQDAARDLGNVSSTIWGVVSAALSLQGQQLRKATILGFLLRVLLTTELVRGGLSHAVAGWANAKGRQLRSAFRREHWRRKMLNVPAPPATTAVYSVRLATCVVGIISSLLVYAYLQERIMALPLTTDAAGQPVFFRDSLFLVLQNRLYAALAAVFVLLWQGDRSGMRPQAPLYKYASVSLSNVVATWAQYSALAWVSMPTQTLGKCAKMIPVLVWGSIMSGKRYTLSDYGVAAAVAAGCTLFLLAGNIQAKYSAEQNSLYGLVLMVVYLAFDGFTSTFQEKLFRGYPMSTYNQMLFVNLTSACISFLGVASSGRLAADLQLCWQYPRLFIDASVLSAAAVIAQFFITYTIKEFGALVYATVITTRQILTILLSNLFFAHGLTVQQWCGAAIVFSALYLKSYTQQMSRRATKPAAAPLDNDNGPASEESKAFHVAAVALPQTAQECRALAH